MRTILSIIMILASVGGFIIYIVPTYKDAQTISQKKTEYLGLLDNATKLEKQRNDLLLKYNSVEKSDIERLEKMLPANPDNVKLILEIDALAKTQGLSLQNVKIKSSETDAKSKPATTKVNADIGTLTLEFTTVGPYPGYVKFVNILEKNLRIMDVQKVTFLAPDDKTSYQYQTTVETYWVK